MATESIVIKVSQDGAKETARDLEKIGKSAEGAASGIGILKTALAALMTVMSFNVFKEFSSTWVQLKSQVDGFTSSMGETNAVMDRLVEIANRNKAALDITAQTYISNAAALTELGYSTKSQIDFTEAMSNALTVSGAKGQKAETVINALSKAMMKGKLDGMNWQTVLQQGGRVVTALADGLGVSLAELRKMAADGDLSSNSVFTALTSQLEKLAEEADKMPSTMNDALQELTTSFTAAIGKFDEDFGITEKFVSVVQTISENLNIILPIIYGIGAAIAVAFLPTVLSAFWASLNMIWLLLMSIPAAPFLALGVAIAGVGVALYGMRDEIKLGIDETTTLGNLMNVVMEDISAGWNNVTNLMDAVWYNLTADAIPALNAVDTASSNTTSSIMKGFLSLFSGLENGWLGTIQFVAKLFDFMGGFVMGSCNFIWAAFQWVGQGIVGAFKVAMNVAVKIVFEKANMMIGILNSIFGAVGVDLIKPIELKLDVKGTTKDIEKAGKDMGTAFERGFKSQGSFLEKKVLDYGKRARADALKNPKKGGIGDTNKAVNPLGDAGKGRKGGKDNASKELDDLTKAYESLKGTLDPIWKAQQEVTKGEETLNKAMSAGLVSLEEKDRLMELLNEKYKDALDPLGKINRDMQKELDLLKLDANSRKVKIELDKQIQDLQGKGKILKDAEIEGLRQSIELQQREIELARLRDGFQANSGAAQVDALKNQATALKQLQEMNIGFGKGDAANALVSILPNAEEVLAGTQIMLDAQLQQQETYYAALKVLRDTYGVGELDYQKMLTNYNNIELQKRYDGYGDFWGNLASAASQGNSQLAAVAKAAGIAQMMINAQVAASEAMKQGGMMGYAQAALAYASVMTRVAAVQSTNTSFGFKTGGSFIVGGSGAPDSQQVAFRASPGEKVSITKANNVRKGDQQDGASSSSSGGGGTKIINVVGDGPIENYMTSSSGERVFLNYIGENKSAIKAMLE